MNVPLQEIEKEKTQKHGEEGDVKMEVNMRVIHYKPKTHEKLGKMYSMNSPSQSPKETNPADSLVLDFQ